MAATAIECSMRDSAQKLIPKTGVSVLAWLWKVAEEMRETLGSEFRRTVGKLRNSSRTLVTIELCGGSTTEPLLFENPGIVVFGR